MMKREWIIEADVYRLRRQLLEARDGKMRSEIELLIQSKEKLLTRIRDSGAAG